MSQNSPLLKKTGETKVFRDPVHGYIRVDYQIIWDLINSPEFQRLRRIHQLGGVSVVYHNAEHTRFAHSLGVYEVTRRIIQEAVSVAEILSEEEQVSVMAAALLHDVGHGPFSHFYEAVSDISHEELGMKIILSEKTQINRILKKADKNLPEKIVSVLSGKAAPSLMNSIISSQLDADRMDYLLRDAYETGTTYGNFDLERVIRTLRADENSLYIKKSGIHSVEDYIMARYQMYFQVYQHPDAYGFELLISRFFGRLAELAEDRPSKNDHLDFQIRFLAEELDLLKHPEKMLEESKIQLLDEAMIYSMIRRALSSEDAVLSDLADRILSRRLLSWMDNPGPEDIENIIKRAEDQGFRTDLYLDIMEPSISEYLPYHEKSKPIMVMENNGKKSLLSESSELASALLQVRKPQALRIYFPREIGSESDFQK